MLPLVVLPPYDISIHAPLTRCDVTGIIQIPDGKLIQSTHLLRVATVGDVSLRPYFRFQSTHLLRGATTATTMESRINTFQSTHLLRGATAGVRGQGCRARISIHTPLTRCDVTPGNAATPDFYFNPHTSYEVRQILSLFLARLYAFQSTHLLRGATNVLYFIQSR